MATVQTLLPRSQAAWDAFLARVTELGGEVLEPQWLGNITPHRVRCPEGHECTPRPNDARKGIGICRTCAGQDPRVAAATFRASLDELGATLLEPRWLGCDTPHRVRCAEGHQCAPRPSSVRRGQGICRTCVGKDSKVAWAAFRARVAELGGEVLEPRPLGKDTPHRVRCAEGHESRTSPGHVRGGRGICRVCAGKDSEAAWSAFRTRVAELGGEVLEPEWLGSNTQHRVRCREGHERVTMPSNVRQGWGICSTCAGKVWDVFYVVADDINDVVKFGITSGNPRPRLVVHGRDGFDRVTRLIEGMPGDLAPRLERAVLAALRDAREVPVRGREYFPARVLGLVLDVVDGWTAAPPAPVSEPVQLTLDIAA